MNSKLILLVLGCVLLMNCQKNKPNKNITITNEVPASFDMYKSSEMAVLMRTMLAENKELRMQIINEEEIGDFNEAYLKIHSAVMTDASQRDETYPIYAEHFENMQKQIFVVKKTQRKEQFNNAVNACIACHTDRCTGPIPRIQKLLIK